MKKLLRDYPIGAIALMLLACIKFEYQTDAWSISSPGLAGGVVVLGIIAIVLLFRIFIAAQDVCIARGFLPSKIRCKYDALIPIGILAVAICPRWVGEPFKGAGESGFRWVFAWSDSQWAAPFIGALVGVVFLTRIFYLFRAIAHGFAGTRAETSATNSSALLGKTLIILALLFVGLTIWWFQDSRTPASTGTRGSTGTLGKYKFSSLAEVKALNSEIIGWLSQRGYAPCTNETYEALVGGNEWKMPSLLVTHRYNPTNQVWVFIPECYHADRNIQIIGYHLNLQGVLGEVNQHQADFSFTRSGFQKRFPSTWEYQPPDAEQRIEPMTRSAFILVPRLSTVDALLVMAQPHR